MYLVYNEHPKTLVKTPRSLHKNYSEAIKALKEQVADYVTKYKGGLKVVYVNDLDDIKNYPDVRYFVRISEEYSNRYVIYEQKSELEKGWVYNATKPEINEIMLFSIFDLGTVLDEMEGENLVVNDETDFIRKLGKSNDQRSMAHGNHVLLVEDLKAFLKKNPKFYKE